MQDEQNIEETSNVDDIVEKAFQVKSRSEISDYKPVSKEKLFASRKKKDDITIELLLDNEKVHMTFSYPSKLDMALSSSSLFTEDSDEINFEDLEKERLLEHQRSLIQRLAKDPTFTLEEINELDENLIFDIYTAIQNFSQQDDVNSFQEVGEN